MAGRAPKRRTASSSSCASERSGIASKGRTPAAERATQARPPGAERAPGGRPRVGWASPAPVAPAAFPAGGEAGAWGGLSIASIAALLVEYPAGDVVWTAARPDAAGAAGRRAPGGAVSSI